MIDYDAADKIVETLTHLKDYKEKMPDVDVKKAKEYIFELDFSMLFEKIVNHSTVGHKWTAQEANEGIAFYRNFLYINAKYGKKTPVIPPSIEIDEIWHNHILDTMAYQRDCNSIFGFYFHHYPYFGIRSESDKLNLNDSFEITQKLHEKEFGFKIWKIWS